MVRLVLVVLWLTAATATWWMAPRHVDYDRARADVAAERVIAYQWGDSWDDEDSRRWFGPATLGSSGELGPLFAWRAPDGRVYWTDTDDYHEVTVGGTVDEDRYTGPGAVRIAEDLRAARMEGRTGDVGRFHPLTGWAGIILGVISLGVLVAGPAPVLGTRWFWFWLIYMVPYGLGLLFWLARDRPWSSRVPPRSDVGAEDGRDRGYLGFGFALLAGILIQVALLLLNGVTGDMLVPLTTR